MPLPLQARDKIKERKKRKKALRLVRFGPLTRTPASGSGLTPNGKEEERKKYSPIFSVPPLHTRLHKVPKVRRYYLTAEPSVQFHRSQADSISSY